MNLFAWRVRTFRVPRSLQGDEAAREAVCARRVRTLVVAEGLPIFPNRGSRSPSAGLRFAWGRRTLRVLHLANRANDFHWHHRMAHLSHEPFCLALAPQSEFLPSGVTAGQAEDRAAGELRRSCRHELRLIRTNMMSWHAISPGGLPLRYAAAAPRIAGESNMSAILGSAQRNEQIFLRGPSGAIRILDSIDGFYAVDIVLRKALISCAGQDNFFVPNVWI